jgi:hypothetical protein
VLSDFLKSFTALFKPSFPRKRESSGQQVRLLKVWIPAFAGMTVKQNSVPVENPAQMLSGKPAVPCPRLPALVETLT